MTKEGLEKLELLRDLFNPIIILLKQHLDTQEEIRDIKKRLTALEEVEK